MTTTIPKDAFRIFTGRDGSKNIDYIDGMGSVVSLIPQAKHKRLLDGYYTRDFKLIRRSAKPDIRQRNISELFVGKAGFRQDQERDPHTGKWIPEGGHDLTTISYRGHDEGSSDPSMNFTQEKGAFASGAAVKNIMARIPASHRELLRNVPKTAVLDMSRYARRLKLDPNEEHFAAGFFNPKTGITVAEGWDNPKFGFMRFADTERSAAHEFGHAFDFFSSGGRDYGFSGALAGTIMSEYSNSTAREKYFSEHYDAASMPRELFAEIYAAMYGGTATPKAKEFMGYTLTQSGVLRRFPRTVAAIRDWQPA